MSLGEVWVSAHGTHDKQPMNDTMGHQDRLQLCPRQTCPAENLRLSSYSST